ncbi:hypothetical protein [Streptomyces sp. NBC_01304]|uniref:hypothetical protein n=1 Tax=Streptomyces sp. NBC_01304 TaxID=2903818 RepID=UPI002E110A1E|nr:hypothetical protein OG430_44955 [Streptomyces sp. NBC_01304]
MTAPRPDYETLRTHLDTTQRLGRLLYASPHPAACDELIGALKAALRAAQGLYRPTATGCLTHPAGPVEPEPQPGDTRCLLCNGRRRGTRPREAR